MDDSSDDGCGPREAQADSEPENVSNPAAKPTVPTPTSLPPPVSRTLGEDIENAAMIRNRAASRVAIKMPWEVGLMGKLFGKEFPTVQVLKLEPRLPVFSLPASSARPAAETLPEPRKPVVSSLLRKLRNVSLKETGDALRFRAINRWRMIIEQDLNSSQVGLQLTEMIEDGKSEALVCSTLEDVFATKSVATLMKRSASVLKYF